MLRVSQLAATALASGAALAAPCPGEHRGTLEEWKCFGEVEYTSRTEGEADFGARFVVFANGERLYEKREAAAKKKLMLDGYTVYHGLEREDSTNIGRHDPFIFFEFALVTPLVALAATGRAPSTIPNGTTAVLYTVDSPPIALMREIGIRSVKGTVERSGEDYVFSADSTGNVATGLLALSVSGRWSSALVAPWPDSMPLEGWRYHCAPTGPDWRNNHRPVPAGVTLGAVRRGWKGSCD
jgi:hypothetical protein